MVPSKALKPGETAAIDYRDPDERRNAVKGSYKLESVDGGVAKVLTKIEISSTELTKPLHVEFSSMIDLSTFRAKHIEGKATGVAGVAAKPEDVEFSMDRVG